MATIGLIGGLSPQSTILYYQWINEAFMERLGGVSGADILISSVNQEEILQLRLKGDWERVGEILTQKALLLQNAGADMVLVSCNSVHHVAERIEKSLSVPFIHIADTVAHAVKKAGLSKIGLLGTNFTTQMGFYTNRLAVNGVEAILPPKDECDYMNHVIFNELCKGKVLDSSREKYKEIISHLAQSGAEGVILGCTEICMLISQDDVDVPVFDSSRAHVDYVIEKALESKKN